PRPRRRWAGAWPPRCWPRAGSPTCRPPETRMSGAPATVLVVRPRAQADAWVDALAALGVRAGVAAGGALAGGAAAGLRQPQRGARLLRRGRGRARGARVARACLGRGH